MQSCCQSKQKSFGFEENLSYKLAIALYPTSVLDTEPNKTSKSTIKQKWSTFSWAVHRIQPLIIFHFFFIWMHIFRRSWERHRKIFSFIYLVRGIPYPRGAGAASRDQSLAMSTPTSGLCSRESLCYLHLYCNPTFFSFSYWPPPLNKFHNHRKENRGVTFTIPFNDFDPCFDFGYCTFQTVVYLSIV